MADQTNQNQAGEVAPGNDTPATSNLPTANNPEPNAAVATPEKPAAKAAKKEKPPAVEDKPFEEFIQQEYLPALQKAIVQEGVPDIQLSFAKQKFPLTGFNSDEECWQIIGSWQEGSRKFNVYFPDADIQGKKGFSCHEGKKASTLESFLIDERKITLELLVSRLVYRLNGQKWLGRN
ncbi:DUF2996 domain-containing protein [Cronbergia sp. UHCC 0137]|uniref:DUF2996 domain-containing protein n=1 Tax=Cronbergia sp. UHCC 0137 TaxID=3110239 RepID=UPI002B1EC15D|nr:DUF2996 domain-containing protein [Cronbergia sp. UHCC 0137]MEA5617629.1 DUF2996 domain-containing protein [Cronbergia sp. UHCC 0137]